MEVESPNSLKNVEQELETIKRRVQKLQDKTKKQRVSTNRHKSLANDVLQKKIFIARSLAETEKSKEEHEKRESRRIQELKQLNAYRRAKHSNQLNNIRKAVYLVKVDDARELKKISQQHREELNRLNKSNVQLKRERREKIRSQGGKQEKYWKQKLYKLYLENHASKLQQEEEIKIKQEEIQRLQQEQIALKKDLQTVNMASQQSKREYLSALSLPLKKIAEIIDESGERAVDEPSQKTEQEYEKQSNDNNMAGSQSEKISRVKVKKENGLLFNRNQERENQKDKVFPKTEVNDTKLKIILEKLQKKK